MSSSSTLLVSVVQAWGYGAYRNSSDDPSTLSAINAQLLSHGWTKRPLNLSALYEKDYTEVVTVLFELLASSVVSTIRFSVIEAGLITQANLDQVDALSSRYRTLTYEHERLLKTYMGSKANGTKLQTELAGWKAKCVDLEKRLGNEEAKVKELREEVGRGRKAIDGVRVAASVSSVPCRSGAKLIRQHEGKKAQTRLDKAQAQLMKLSNDASLASRPQGLVILNPIHPGKGVPVGVRRIRTTLQEHTLTLLRPPNRLYSSRLSGVLLKLVNLYKRRPSRSDTSLCRLEALFGSC